MEEACTLNNVLVLLLIVSVTMNFIVLGAWLYNKKVAHPEDIAMFKRKHNIEFDESENYK